MNFKIDENLPVTSAFEEADKSIILMEQGRHVLENPIFRQSPKQADLAERPAILEPVPLPFQKLGGYAATST